MRSLSALFVASIAVGCASLANAQVKNEDAPYGLRLRVGYGTSGTFINDFNQSVSINGLELGLDAPLTRMGSIEYFASGSVLLGGRLSQGSDTDGEIFRFMLSAKTNLSRRGEYLMAGVGFSSVSRRSPTFTGESGFVSRIALGFPIKRIIGKSDNALEFSTVLSGSGQLRGFSIGISAAF